MKQTKHTPGPWNWTSELTEKGKLTGKQIIYDNYETLGYRYRDIAHLPPCKDKKEVRANARLIAAAPELLSACRATLSDVLYDEESEHTLCYSTLQLLKNAIAKAEGEEK